MKKLTFYTNLASTIFANLKKIEILRKIEVDPIPPRSFICLLAYLWTNRKLKNDIKCNSAQKTLFPILFDFRNQGKFIIAKAEPGKTLFF